MGLYGIAPGSFSNSISCKLRTVSLDNNIEHDVLSYVWGNAKDRQIISINGLELRVTRNLATALQFFRTGRIRTVWTGTICEYSGRSAINSLKNLRYLI